MGYGEIPNNDDLAILASQHYYAEITSYYVADDSEMQVTQSKRAQDYADTVSLYEYVSGAPADAVTYDVYIIGTKSMFVGSDGTYRETVYDESEISTKEDVLAMIEANDDSDTGFTFVSTGKSTIALIDDTTEYDYYEFAYSGTYEVDGQTYTEEYTQKVYVSGTKLVAFETFTPSEEYGDSTNVAVYDKLTAEIPDGFMALPDVSNLEKDES